MIAAVKIFIVSWLSLIFFWLAALVFCFWGSETGNRFWKRRFFIGIPFFSTFCFLVFAFGVPRYFIYDHIAPQSFEGKLYYPAVKNHLIFQGAKYKTHGMMSKDLNDFVAGDKYFAAFNVQAKSEYASATGWTRFTNELLLLGLFITWWLLINKLHNASIASKLYKEAKASPSLSTLNSYLNASKALWLIQPIKRKKSKKQLAKIRLLYVSYLERVLFKCAENAEETSKPLLNMLCTEFKRFKHSPPKISVDANLIDISTPESKEKFEQGVNYGREYFVPTKALLSTKIAEAFASTLNAFLPENFVEASDEPDAIKLYGEFVYKAVGNIEYKDGNHSPNITLKTRLVRRAENNALFYKEAQYLRQLRVRENKTELSQNVAATSFAHFLTNNILMHTENVNASIKIDKSQYEAKLADLKKQKIDLFDTLIKECKSASTEAAVLSAVGVAMQKHPELVDKVMANVYEFLSVNSDLITEIVAQEVVAGLFEEVVGGLDV